MSQISFDELLSKVVKEGASDLHIAVGRPPTIRLDGSLVPLPKEEIITPEIARAFIFSILDEEKREKFIKEKEMDLSYNFRDRARFRVNLYHQRGFMGAALRLIPAKVSTFKELSLPPILEELAKTQQGFFLVVGPTGHGKSTTLAAFIDYMNQTRNDHIITIEDPIEYLFTSDKAIIDQREVGVDTQDFHRALKSMFREDVDIAMVGKMRDAETIATAVTAAETGHFILSTLHTNSASQTIDRIIDTFPSNQQGQIKAQLSSTLIGILSQRLIPRIKGGLIPAVEIMIANPAVRNLIREDKTHELDFVIDTGLDQGMISLNRSLVNLVRAGEIDMENATAYSPNPKEFRGLIKS